MKVYQFIKVVLLILLLSSNLMLGQKRYMATRDVKVNQCFEQTAENRTEKNQIVELRVLQTQTDFKVSLAQECGSPDSADLGAFFQFTAF